jgi:hypothetical protein
MDTTDLSEARSTYIMDRQIASICSRPAAGTVPLYRSFNPTTNLYLTTLSLDGKDIAGFQLGSPIGYVYFNKNEEASVQIYRNYKDGTNGEKHRYMTTNIESEGTGDGYKSFPAYWTMPLGPDTGVPCSPIALYRKRFKHPFDKKIAHMDTTDLSEARSTLLERQIASICSRPAAGTVALYRSFNPTTYLYLTTLSLDGKDIAGFQLGSPIGYVYLNKNKEAPVQIYRNMKLETNGGNNRYLTTNIKTEGLEFGYKSFPVYWAKPPIATN